MKRSGRIEVVQAVAENEEQKERRLMAETQRELDTALGRLEELKAYRQLYASSERPRSGAAAPQWQDYHKFMDRLDRAVVAQEQLVDDGRRKRKAHQRRWMVKRQRLESLSRVVDRFRKEEADEEERRLQKQQDELTVSRWPFGAGR